MVLENSDSAIYQFVVDQILPKNFVDFSEGGVFDDSCVFCQRPHNNLPLELANVRAIVPSTVYMCGVCNKKYQKIANVDQHSQYDEEIHTPLPEPQKISGTILARMAKLGEDWSKYVYELDESIRGKPNEESTHCHLCHLSTGKSSGVRVPMILPSTLNGYCKDMVFCNPCYMDCLEQDEDFFSHVYKDTCSSCNRSYFITKEEYGARNETGTLGEHVCGNCFSLKLKKDPHHYFNPTECESMLCSETLIVDETILSPEPPFSLPIHCKSCKRVKTSFIPTHIQRKDYLERMNSMKVIRTFRKDLFILIENYDGTYQYTISKYKETTDRLEMLCSRYVHHCSFDEVMELAFFRLETYVTEENKQLKIPYNET